MNLFILFLILNFTSYKISSSSLVPVEFGRLNQTEKIKYPILKNYVVHVILVELNIISWRRKSNSFQE